MKLKEALGELWTDEIADRLKGKTFLDNSEGIYISKDRADREREEAVAEISRELETAKESLKQAGIDSKELERLKEFEQTAIAKEKKQKATAAVKDMLEKNKVKPSIINRELRAVNADSVALDENGNVTEEFEKSYMDAFRTDAPDGFETAPSGTGNPSRPPMQTAAALPNGGEHSSIAEALAEYYGKN